MKILKYLFFLILIAIIAGAIYIATKDGDYQIEETITINAPAPVIYSEVNNYTNWESWGPWRTTADDVIVNYQEVTRGEGAGFSWRSDEGEGSITTIKANPNESLEQDVNYKPSFAESSGIMYWNFEEVEDGTRVTVGMKGSQSFKEKLAYALRDDTFPSLMEPKLEAGLEQLNEEVIQKMSVYSINVDGVTTHGGGFYMYTTTATKIDQIPTRMEKMVSEVENYMENNNITRLGSPFVLYNDFNEQNNTAIYSVGIFTPSLVITPTDSDILNGMMPVQKVVKTTLKGSRENLREAWDRAYQYIKENDLQLDEESQPFEIYRTDAESTINPANHITEVYIPIIDAQASDYQLPE